MVKKPRRRRKERLTLTPEQANAFLDAARGDRLYALFVVALATGMRMGEMLGLRWRDVDLDAGSIWVQRAQVAGEARVYLDTGGGVDRGG